MKRSLSYIWLVASLCVCFLIAGCGAYYKVTDHQSGKVYFTQDVDRATGGAVKLKDDRSGSTVTLQNSEVKEISKDEYKAGLAAPAAAPKPAPAPATTPTPTAAAAPSAAGTAAAAPAAAPAQETATAPSSEPSGTK